MLRTLYQKGLSLISCLIDFFLALNFFSIMINVPFPHLLKLIEMLLKGPEKAKSAIYYIYLSIGWEFSRITVDT